MEFYHVDRANRLSMGIQNLFPAPDDLIKNFFPDGISRYGMKHFTGNSCFSKFTDYNVAKEPLITLSDVLSQPFNFKGQSINFNLGFFNNKCVTTYPSLIDLVFELVRRIDFPERPSRFQSIFVWKNLSEAISFRKDTKYCRDHNSDIYKIHGDNFFEADMNLLRAGPNIAGILNFAYRYWSGDKSRKPVMEILLGHPATVTGTVSDEEIKEEYKVEAI